MNKISEEFDRLAPEYESNRLSVWYKAHGELILQHLPDDLSGGVCDIGCGSGWLLRKILTTRASGSLRGHGFDISSVMLHEAKTKMSNAGLDKISLTLADWETADVQDLAGQFSTVIIANSLHYFADPVAAVKKAFTLLEPGGKILVLERDKRGSLLTVVWDFLHRFLIRDHVRFYSAKHLQTMLVEVGFKDVKLAEKVTRYFWNNKLFTNVVLLVGSK